MIPNVPNRSKLLKRRLKLLFRNIRMKVADVNLSVGLILSPAIWDRARVGKNSS